MSRPTAHPPEALGSLAYLVPEEVAELLRLSVKSVYRLARTEPTFPVLKIGGSIRFPRERLLQWLRQREQGPGRPRRLREPKPSGAEVRVIPSISVDGEPHCAGGCATEAGEVGREAR